MTMLILAHDMVGHLLLFAFTKTHGPDSLQAPDDEQEAPLRNGSVEAKLVVRVVLVFQAPQTRLAPVLTAVPVLGRLVTKGVVDIDVHILTVRAFVEDLSELNTELGCLFVNRRTGRLICN